MMRAMSASTQHNHVAEDGARREKLSRRSPLVWLWLVILPVAIFLRLFALSRKSIYLDEALSVLYAQLSWPEFVKVLSSYEANMTLYYVLLRGMVLAGDSEFWVRILSALVGVLAVPAIYALGTRLFDRRTGLLAAWVLAINACHVVYSQEARGYALAVLLVTLSSWLFVRGVEAPSWTTWLLYPIISALGVYSHFYSVLIVAAQWASLLVLPRRLLPLKHLLVAIVLAAVLIAPAARFVVTQNVGQIDWLSRISWLEVYHTAVFLAAEGGKVAGNLLLVLCLVALALAAREVFRRSHADASLERWKELFAWSWLLLPMLITAFGSLWRPMFFHRFLIVCLPAFVLLVARGLTRLPLRSAVIVAFSALAIVTVFLSYSRTREDWRGATQHVLSHAQPGDVIWFLHDYGAVPYRYYEAKMHGGVYPSEVPDASASLQAKTRVWVVLYPLTPLAITVESQMRTKYPLLEQASFRGLRLALFDLKSTDRKVENRR
jgi:mannosyltransferase